MILSRFWYALITISAVIGFAAALVTANLVDNHYRTAVVNDLVRDRFEIEQTLKLDARARLDAIAPIAANGDVRSALRRASARRDPSEIDEELSTGLRQNLQRLNAQLEQMSGDLVFAVDANGWIVAAIAPVNPPDGAGLGQFPLVRRALEGYVRDDVWVYNEEVYRMAARPVVDGGQYVGALIHGKRVDDQLAELLSQRLDGASVGFFRGTTMFAGYMPAGAPRRDEMGENLDDVLGNERYQSGERTEEMPLSSGGLAVYSRITGSARFANVGYSVSRPVRSLAGPWAIFDEVGSEQWAQLPWLPLGGGGFLIFLLSMFWMWVERDRPLSKLKRASASLKEAPENRLTITDFGGRYRAIANSVNEAIDNAATAAGAGAPKSAAKNLDAILGPTGQEEGSPAFFGFAGGDDGPAPDLPEVPPAQPNQPAGGLPPIGAGPAGGLPPPPGDSPVAAPPKPAAPKPPPPKPPAPPSRPKPPPPKPPAPAPEAKDEEKDEAPASFDAPPKNSKKRLKSTLLGVAPPDEDDEEEEEEEATMVARVPRELLKQSAGGDDEETAHFREVFEKFVATKKECGEPTSNLTFDKFRVTLEKNRDQIVKRHGARRVRFTVYTKNGKAALKATPIKD